DGGKVKACRDHLIFYSLPLKKLCYHGGNTGSISAASFRARDCVKTPLMVREPHHERVVQLARSSTLTDRPELSRRALVGFSRSLRQREILDSSRPLGMTNSSGVSPHRLKGWGAVRTITGRRNSG